MDIGQGTFTKVLNNDFPLQVNNSAIKTFCNSFNSTYDTYLDEDLTNYVVPSGFQLRVIGVEFSLYRDTNGAGAVYFGYGDTVASSATLPTNNVNTFFVCSWLTGGKRTYHSCDIVIPEGKYPFSGLTSSNLSGSSAIYAILEAV